MPLARRACAPPSTQTARQCPRACFRRVRVWVSRAVVERIRTIRTARTTIRITVVLRIRRSGVAGSRVALSCYTFIAADGVGAASPVFVVELNCQVGRTPTTHHSAHQRPSELVDFVAREACHFNVVLVSAGTSFRAVVVHGWMPAGRHKRGCGRRQWSCRGKDAIAPANHLQQSLVSQSVSH